MVRAATDVCASPRLVYFTPDGRWPEGGLMLDLLAIDWAFVTGLLLCLLPLANVLQGCTCCGTCAIASDTFTRADNTDISANIVAPDTVSSWTESSGAWAIVSNTLQCTSTGIVICDDAHPDGDSTMVVECDIKHGTSGSTCDILVALVDSTRYYYARYIFGTNSIQLRHKNDASDSLLTSVSATLAINTAYAAKVCVSEAGVVTAYLDGTEKVTDAGNTPTGTKCGLGASGSGTATFDSFVISKAHNATGATACPRCTYAHATCDAFDRDTMCLGEDYPSEMDVTIPAGVFTGNAKCDANCTTLNDTTFTLTLNPVGTGTPTTCSPDGDPGALIWSLTISDFCYSATHADYIDVVICLEMICVGTQILTSVVVRWVTASDGVSRYTEIWYRYLAPNQQEECRDGFTLPWVYSDTGAKFCAITGSPSSITVEPR